MKDKFNNSIGPLAHKTGSSSNKGLRAVVAIMALLLGLQTATQVFAFDFQYHILLGMNVFHIYAPWAIIDWALKWGDMYSSYLLHAGNFGILVAGVGLLLQVVVMMVLDNSAKASLYMHGSARWANLKDIQLSGLLPRPRKLTEWILGVKQLKVAGVFVGAWQDKRGKSHYLRH
ncbi:MAG: conjugal transfer protein TraG, partial [Methyloglobulus sp.]|nr:conjugal transfer protein TraG [Methyloglobulus sp.]